MKLWETEEVNDQRTELEREIAQFTAGDDVKYDQNLVKYDLLGSMAHIEALQESSILTEKETETLHSALVDLLDREITLTPEDEDVHTKIESLLVDELGTLGEKVHAARSRNDQVLVDLRLYAKDRIYEVARLVIELASSLTSTAAGHEDTPMPGFTHTRQAMPASVALWAASFAESLLDDLLWLKAGFRLVDQNPLGAAAGYGVPFGLDRGLTANLLGFSRVQKNTLYVVNSRGKFELAILMHLLAIQLTLNKLSSDLILLSGGEYNFFNLPEQFTTGSSIMPHKQNPDVLELIRSRSSLLSGQVNAVFGTINSLRSGYNRDSQPSKASLMEGFKDTKSSLSLMASLIEELKVNEDNLWESLKPDLFATDRVFALVREGVPFRKAYRKVKRGLEDETRAPSKGQVLEFLQERNHLGGTGNIGLNQIRATISEERSYWRSREREFTRMINELIELR
ncbi:MAG: argininosuccinate lyase [Candidatus Bipolaricaulota bacterium]